MTKIVWLKDALDDLRGIGDYIARENPAASRRVVRAIRDNVNILHEHPAIGRPGRLTGTRELVVSHYRYIVAYREVATSVQILAVVHTSRRWPEQMP
jgi:addiction module RelE/StbE family toxin